MLTKKELDEVKEYLEQSQNPIFFFDNDVDGFCSFILLQKALGRGKGVAIKSFPSLDERYLRKVEELNPDHVFILDKPLVSSEFIDELERKSIPITWIDHHETEIETELHNRVNYFNSFPSSEPTTYLAYNIFKNKLDMWLAIVGCIGDNFLPEFAEEFKEKYPQLLSTVTSPFDSLYNTELGKIASMINFGLKDTTTNVLKMIRLFIQSKSPSNILEESEKTMILHKKYLKMMKKIDSLTSKKKNLTSQMIILEYSGEISMSSELANRLQYENKDKTVLVIYKKQDICNVSVRGKNVKTALLSSINDISGATGGGHPDACGARIPTNDLEIFKKSFINYESK